MGKITNSAIPNEPLNKIAVVGFAKFDGAAQFIQQDFSLDGLIHSEPNVTTLEVGSFTHFDGDQHFPRL